MISLAVSPMLNEWDFIIVFVLCLLACLLATRVIR